MHSFFSRFRRSTFLRRAAVMLASMGTVLAMSSCTSFKSLPQEFCVASAAGDLEKVRALLKEHPKLIFSKDSEGWTPVHLAALNGRKDVVELLLAKGAEIEARNTDDSTPLHLAATQGHADVVELLLAEGADVNARDDLDATPLHLAAKYGHKDVAELLRRHGGTE